MQENKTYKTLALENIDSWSINDINTLSKIYQGVKTKQEAIELWKSGTRVKLGEVTDMYTIFCNLIKDDNDINISVSDFISELLFNDYGNRKYTELSRMFVLSNGIWYDTEYC